MKQKLFTFLLFSTVIFASCNKDKVYPNIKEYDDQQIQNYISTNGLSSMLRDTSDGDTSGMYYQLIDKGLVDSPRIQYSDRVAMVYTIRSFDGKYIASDTIVNHYYGFLGQFKSANLPQGLQNAIYNVLRYKGASARLLIPSRMAYGVNGYGSGSSSSGNRIAGNQCLDYWVRIVADQPAYDDLSINKYANAYGIGITGYTKTASGLYYKVSGSDTGSVIARTSSVGVTYSLYNMNNTKIDEATSSTTFVVEQLVPGAIEGLMKAKNGQTVSLIVPSALAYGTSGSTSIPAFSCLKWDFSITSVSSNEGTTE
ncbi:FKBP-type peptidyl-prolyl cis-trans isomerase [Mucilaginibacter sp. JRF]|uniref:FKBP-type peptidyl-prolyl cis-trans isomerase n=1 Tax=Mucilaginibacter sp. JRF TaxID=2780088 RepID=UPI0018801880|nr:FKBP-type peptidyl-prolyl cis-trans isomerase [Mucilaginibacter sp. JRF]MBE9585005.1 FKBP-type peptidyl-prolyl cis-trans isomerase [Mucilaginibacter sp. JRF]